MANADERLALGVGGSELGLPPSADVAGWLAALELRAWMPGPAGGAAAPATLRGALPGVRTIAVRHPLAEVPLAAAGLVGADLATPVIERGRAEVDQLVATARFAAELRARWVVVELADLPREPGDPDWSAMAAGLLRAREAANRLTGRAADRAAEEARANELHGELVRGFARRRDRALDRLCRALHAVARQMPEVAVALVTPARASQLPSPEMITLIADDLGPRRRFGYWHDPGRARALANLDWQPEERWLDLHGARCVGVDGGDAVGLECGLPAGAGEVDFTTIASAVAAATPFVLQCDGRLGPGPLAGAARHLRTVLG